MKPSRTPELGRIVSEVQKTYEDESRDYDMDGSGECGRMIADGWQNIRNQLVRRHGFANMYHFIAVVEKRTSPRWVHFNFGGL